MLVFDTLAYSEKLEKVGFTHEQAKTQAETLRLVIDNNLATKQNIKELELQIENVKAELKRDIETLDLKIETVKAELKRDIENVKAELKRDIENLDLKIETVKAELKRDIENVRIELKRDIKEMELRLRHDLTLRLGGMMAVSIGVVAALVKLL